MTPSLIAEDIYVHSAQTELVRGVSISVVAGHPLTIVGETGSGKSLLAEAIMGTLPPTLWAEGTVDINGRTSGASDQIARRPQWGRQISLLPQEPWLALDPTMRAGKQISEVFRLIKGDDAKAAAGKSATFLQRLGLRDAGRKHPFALSGGMAQRVVFAATRAGGAPILIVDEPTKGLDAALRDGLVDLLRSAVAEGCALLTITHDLEVARALGGSVAVMLDGQFIETGSAAEILSNPQHDYTRRLIAAEPSAWPKFKAAQAGERVITASGLAKSFGSNTLFRDLDMALSAGERIAISGASGSGKTTLGNVLLGLIAPDTGQVLHAPGVARHRFQKLYQDPPAAFAPRLTMRHALADLITLHALAWYEVDNLMPKLKLGLHLLDRRPDEISGGELQRFALLRALLVKPVVLLADEPTSRLDPITQFETMSLLLDTAREQHIALMLVTHDANIAARTCGRTIQIATSLGIPSGNERQ